MRLQLTGWVGRATASASVLLLATGCSSSSGDTAADTEEITIAVMIGASSNAYYSQNIKAAEAAAKELGDVEIKVFDANFDPAKQISQIQDVVSLGPGVYQGMVVFPLNSATVVPAVESAIDAGIAVAAGNAPVGTSYETADFQVEGMTAQYVNDYGAVGRREAEMVIQACGDLDPCEVAYTKIGFAWAPQTTSIKTFEEELEAHPNIKVVAWPAPAGGTREGGAKVFADTLQTHPELDVAVGLDQELLGAAELFAEHPDIKLIGYGGSKQGVENVQEGLWFANILQAPTVEGEGTVRSIVEFLRDGVEGEGVDVASTLPGGGVVTKDNAGEFTGQFVG